MNIAVIDSDENTVQLFDYALSRYGATVYAADTLEALAQAPPDIIFIETTHHLFEADILQDLSEATTVVALDAVQNFNRLATTTPVNLWLPKPFTARQLQAVMDNIDTAPS